MAFISGSSFDAVNDFKSVKRKVKSTFGGGGNDNVNMHGTPAIALQGNELVNLMERFIFNAMTELEDPAFDFVQMHIYWADRDGLFAPESDEQGQPNVNSALAFLTRIGDTVRHDALEKAMEMLKDIFDVPYSEAGNKRGYYLKNIDGLGTINENFRKRGVPFELSLTLSEDICWRIRSVVKALQTVFYDADRQLEVLPINLRRFNCCLIIKDARNLHLITGSTAHDEAIEQQNIPYAQKKRMQQNIPNPFVTNDANLRKTYIDGTQAMIVNLYCCEFHPVMFDDSIDNTDQGEGKMVTLPLTAMHCNYSMLAPAIDASFAADGDVNDETTKRKKGFWKKLGDKAKAMAAATITSYANAAYNYGKSLAMSMAYDQLEKLGVTKYMNYANQILNGNLGGNIAAIALDKLLAEKLGKAALETYNPYFTDKRYAEEGDAPEDKQYFTDKRYADSYNPESKEQPAMTLEQLAANYE